MESDLYVLSAEDLHELGRLCLSGWSRFSETVMTNLDIEAGWRLMRAGAKRGHVESAHVLARLDSATQPVPPRLANLFVKSRWIADAFDGDYSGLGYYYRGAAALLYKAPKDLQLLQIAAELGDAFAKIVLGRQRSISEQRLDTHDSAACKDAELRQLWTTADEERRNGGEVSEAVWAGARMNHPKCMERVAHFYFQSYSWTSSEADLRSFWMWQSRAVMWLALSWEKESKKLMQSSAMRFNVETSTPELLYMIGFHYDQIHCLAPHRFDYRKPNKFERECASFEPALVCYQETARACRRATVATLWALRPLLHRDVVRLIARMVWVTRHNVRMWYALCRPPLPAPTTVAERRINEFFKKR
jgi:hypothetical protein